VIKAVIAVAYTITGVVEVGVRQQHAVYGAELTVSRVIPKPLPDTRYRQVVPIKPFQRRQQAHSERVQQPGTAAGADVLLVETLVPLKGKAEIQQQPAAFVLQQHLVATYLVDAAIEGQAYHNLPTSHLSLFFTAATQA
jgi:hypothetical protein